MGRAQQGELDGRTYAFVQPKPQELIHVEWVIYCEDDDCFYLPAPDEDAHINYMGLKGGFAVCYDLYEGDEPAELTDGGAYAFHAVNRRQAGDDRRAFNPPRRRRLERRLHRLSPETARRSHRHQPR